MIKTANVQKYSLNESGHLLKHYLRQAPGRENVDMSLSHLNENYAQDIQPLDPMDFIHKRLSEVKHLKRKDINVMCTWVISCPKTLPEQDRERFLLSAFAYCVQKYGKENTIGCYIQDEPGAVWHMHYCFLPIIKKNEEERLLAKECVNRKELKKFHPALQKHVERELGYKVDVLNNATLEGNRAIEELKRGTAQKQLNLERATYAAEKAVAMRELRELNEEINRVKSEWKKVTDIKPNRTILGKKKGTVTIPLEQWQYLQRLEAKEMDLKKRELECEKRLKELEYEKRNVITIRDRELRMNDRLLNVLKSVDQFKDRNGRTVHDVVYGADSREEKHHEKAFHDDYER